MKNWIILACVVPFYMVECFSISNIALPSTKRSMKSNSIQEAEEIGCVHMESLPGEYTFTSEGDSRVCGFYAIAGPDELVQIQFHEFNIDCRDGGLLAFVDGWEAQGQFFPSEWDHPLSMEERYLTYCGVDEPQRPLLAAQNVALLQFRIPKKGQGFRLSLRFIPNERPCNIVSLQEHGVFTLRNFGMHSNCSISVMYPEKFDVLSIDVGQTSEFPEITKETGVLKQCIAGGAQDYVELLDGNGLDSSYMWREVDVCGLSSKPGHGLREAHIWRHSVIDVGSISIRREREHLDIVPTSIRILCDQNMTASPIALGCQHSVIRLVSSGQYYNSITVRHSALTPEEMTLLGDIEC